MYVCIYIFVCIYIYRFVCVYLQLAARTMSGVSFVTLFEPCFGQHFQTLGFQNISLKNQGETDNPGCLIFEKR